MKESDMRHTWEAYTATWHSADPVERLKGFRRCLREDVVYCDPNVRAVGYRELAAYMDGFQSQLPGGGFVTRDFSQHHGFALVRWEMVDAAGKPLTPGTSFGSYAPDGRLASMTGFFAAE